MVKYTAPVIAGLLSGLLLAKNLITDLNVTGPEGTKSIDFSVVEKEFEGKELTTTNVNNLRAKIANLFKKNNIAITSVDIDYNRDSGVITAKAELSDKIRIKKFAFDGKRELITPEVRKIARAYTNREIRFAQLSKMTDDMTAAMRKAGYVFSTAVLRPQKSGDGTLLVHLESGHIHSLQFKNTSGKNEENTIKKYLHNFLNDDPLRYKDLEEELEILKRVSGFQYDVQLRPSKKPGKLDILVTKLSKPITFTANISNHNLSKSFVAQEKLTGYLGVNSVSDNFHTSNLTYTLAGPNEMESLNLTHQRYFGVMGDHLVASLGFNHIMSQNLINPNGAVDDPKFKNNGINGQISLHYSDLKSHLHTRTMYYGIFLNNTLTMLQIEDLQSNDRMDPAATYFAVGVHDSINGVHSFSDFNVEAQIGLGIANINNPANLNAEPEYVLFKGSLHHTLALKDSSQVKFTLNAQYTNSNLLSQVMFSYGGMDLGRGYDPSTINGDSGYAVGIEISKPYKLLSTMFVPYMFIDMGYRMNTNMNPDYRDHAASTGFGTRLSFGKIHGDLFIGLPLDKDIPTLARKGTSGSEPRLFWSFSYSV